MLLDLVNSIMANKTQLVMTALYLLLNIISLCSSQISSQKSNSILAKQTVNRTASSGPQSNLSLSEQLAKSQQVAKVEKNVSKSIETLSSTEATAASASIVTQSILTFITVFVFGCAVILAVYAWKKFSESSIR